MATFTRPVLDWIEQQVRAALRAGETDPVLRAVADELFEAKAQSTRPRLLMVDGNEIVGGPVDKPKCHRPRRPKTTLAVAHAAVAAFETGEGLLPHARSESGAYAALRRLRELVDEHIDEKVAFAIERDMQIVERGGQWLITYTPGNIEIVTRTVNEVQTTICATHNPKIENRFTLT